MEIKINTATLNRPEGYRLLDAPGVQVNINDFILQLKAEKAWQTGDRNAITVFKTEGLTIVISALRRGAVMNDFQIDGLLLLQILDGLITVSKDDGQSTRLGSNQLLLLHSAASISILADEEAILQLSYFRISKSGEESII
jgi:hypothetical protein